MRISDWSSDVCSSDLLGTISTPRMRRDFTGTDRGRRERIMNKLRVIQWTTGKVGKHSLRAILDDPRLELAGCYAWSEDKKGVDAGELCGRPATGVAATNDIDELIALGADTVLYTPFEANLEQAIRLPQSGLDVVSTNLFLNSGGIRGQ